MTEEKQIKILILAENDLYLIESADHLKNRGWQVATSASIGDAIQYIVHEMPTHILCGISHYNSKTDKIFQLVKQKLNIETFIFGENTDRKTLIALNTISHLNKLYPPVKGPMIHRRILNSLKQQELESNNPFSIIEKNKLKSQTETTLIFEGSKEKKNNLNFNPFSNPNHSSEENSSLLNSLQLLLQSEEPPPTSSTKKTSPSTDKQNSNKTLILEKDSKKLNLNRSPLIIDSRTDNKQRKNILLQTTPSQKQPQTIEKNSSQNAKRNSSFQLNMKKYLKQFSPHSPKKNTFNSIKQLSILPFESKLMDGFLVVIPHFEKTIDSTLLKKIVKLVSNMAKEEKDYFATTGRIQLEIEEFNFEDWAQKNDVLVQNIQADDKEFTLAFVSDPDWLETMNEQKMNKVSTQTIDPNSPLPFDIFIYLPLNNKFLRCASKGTLLSESIKNKLIKENYTHLFVPQEQKNSLKNYSAHQFFTSLIGKEKIKQIEESSTPIEFL